MTNIPFSPTQSEQKTGERVDEFALEVRQVASIPVKNQTAKSDPDHCTSLTKKYNIVCTE